MTGNQLGVARGVINALTEGNADQAARWFDRLTESSSMGSLERFVAHYQRSAPGVLGQPAPSSEDEFEWCIHGWSCYYTARYEEAGDAFTRARMYGDAWSSWSALGNGKVCSDLGWWACSKDWLLQAMTVARAESDLFRVAECAGALGEVLVRAGRPREAWELFALDASLLPPGSGYRMRLENYQAVCLSRLGLPELAEPRLWGAFFAEVERRPTSAAYSLSSLAAMSVRHDDLWLFDRVEKVIRSRCLSLSGMPGGIVSVASAYRCWKRGESNEVVVAELERAREQFGDLYPVESLWVDRLAAFVSGGQAPDAGVIKALLARKYPCASMIGDPTLDAFSEPWREIRLAEECGFSRVTGGAEEALWLQIDRFFV